MRIALAIVPVFLACALPASAQLAPRARRPPARMPAARRDAVPAKAPSFTPEREAAALVFVKQHHPELASLLERLKPMDEAEYRLAIAELFQVSERLAEVRDADPRRYEINLDAWKAQSRVELLTAQVAGAPGPELESQLRLAIGERIDVEVRRKRLHLAEAEANAERLRRAIRDQETSRDAAIESQMQAGKKKVPDGRRQDEGKPAPAPATASPTPANGGKAR